MTAPAAAPKPPHLVVISPRPDDPDNEDDYQWAFVCPGVTDSCRYFEECWGEGLVHPDPSDVDDYADDNVFHEVEHRWIDGSWMTRTENCIVQHSGLESGEHTELLVEAKGIPGVYPIEWEWDEGLYLGPIDDVSLDEPEAAMTALQPIEETTP